MELARGRSFCPRRTILSRRECATRGFALDQNALKRVMSKVAADGRSAFRGKGGAPSDNAIRAWRARNRDITFRKAENKNAAKLHAERFEHVESFDKSLWSVSEKHSCIFDDPVNLRNMDETAICAQKENMRRFSLVSIAIMAAKEDSEEESQANT